MNLERSLTTILNNQILISFYWNRKYTTFIQYNTYNFQSLVTCLNS